MEQLILHLIGDYWTQSGWMANEKTSKYLPALVHATVYSLPFLLLTRSPLALFVIWFSHFLIDRFRLAKYLCYAKNFLAPPKTYRVPLWLSEEGKPTDFDKTPDTYVLSEKFQWNNCSATGYPSETPQFLAVWLMIIADNTMHLSINYLSLRFL